MRGVAAMDSFVVPMLAFNLLYGFIIVRLGRRELVWIGVTNSPTADWIARQITEAFPWDSAPRYLIRDRDRVFGSVVTQRRLRAMGIRDKPIAPRSPWQNGYAERLIGSIRRECLDHIIVCGEAHLRRVLLSYAHYYNGTRTHRSLDKDAPISCRIPSSAGFITIMSGSSFRYTQVFAQDNLATEPLLRLNTDRHTAPIWSIARLELPLGSDHTRAVLSPEAVTTNRFCASVAPARSANLAARSRSSRFSTSRSATSNTSFSSSACSPNR